MELRAAYQVLSKKFTSIIWFALFNNPIRKGQLCPFSDNKSDLVMVSNPFFFKVFIYVFLVLLGLRCCKLWWARATLRRKQWHPTPVLLPGKSHGRRSLEGCSPWGRWGSGMTEWLHFYFSLSHVGEGNGNPLQCSCLENPRDGGAWWAAVYGVTQSPTRLKWLSSSSSSNSTNLKIYERIRNS